MTKGDLPEIGDKLELFNLSRTKEKTRLLSQMLDIIDENNFMISGPIKNRTIVPFYKDNLVEIAYYKENKGKFFFKGEVIQVTNHKIYELKIKKISPIKKIQQRNFYRLSYMMPIIKTHKVRQNDSYKDIKEDCVTDDISGGGMGILCNYLHNKEEQVNIEIESENLKLSIEGIVVRIDKSSNTDYDYTVGVEFPELSSGERDKIIKFIFNQQRKLRKKGLI